MSRTAAGAIVRRACVGIALANAVLGSAAAWAQEPDLSSHGSTVWDDPARFRALAERSEPWPLRDYPPPPGWPPSRRCEPGEGVLVWVGEARLRLPWFNIVVPEAEHQRLTREWRWNDALTREERCRAAADWSAIPHLNRAYITITDLAGDQLDPHCHRPDLPGDPRPECDRPSSVDWWLAFVRGLPLDVMISAPDRRIPDGEPIDGPLRLVLRDPGHRIETRPRGSPTMRDATGRFGGAILPRAGDPADTREPLFVSCLLSVSEWQPPAPSAPRAWTRCEVRYRHRGVLDVAYRFYREVFDEPDIPALDVRVRRLVQQMLDGAEAP